MRACPCRRTSSPPQPSARTRCSEPLRSVRRSSSLPRTRSCPHRRGAPWPQPPSKRSPSTSAAERSPRAAAGLSEKIVVGGVIDGRNVWRGDLDGAWQRLEALRAASAPAGSQSSTSTSLQHVPHDVADEPDLGSRLVSWLAFADQKVGQVAVLARGLAEGRSGDRERPRGSIRSPRRPAERTRRPRQRSSSSVSRRSPLPTSERGDYATRVAAQEAALDLPVLPTTTIGSFPQTADIRRLRRAA